MTKTFTPVNLPIKKTTFPTLKEFDRTVIDLRKAGHSIDDIAEQLNVPKRRIRETIVKVLKQGAVVDQDLISLRRLEAARLDELLKAVWPRAISGNLKAVNTVLAIERLRCEMYGLMSPKIVMGLQIVTPNATTIAKVFSGEMLTSVINKGIAGLPEAEPPEVIESEVIRRSDSKSS